MDPDAVLLSDQAGFAHELDQMIHGILAGSSGTTPTSPKETPLSPPATENEHDTLPHGRKTWSHTPPTDLSTSPPPAKRLRPSNNAPSFALPGSGGHMHPARAAPLRQHLDDTSTSTGFKPHNDPDVPGRVRHAGLVSSSAATRANATSLGQRAGGDHTSTWSTLRNTVLRQWDPRKADLEYDELLMHRHREKLNNVDRYVPWQPSQLKSKKSGSQRFRFEKLPEKICKKIFALVLISKDPITFDFNWLRPFVKGHARVPVVAEKLQGDDGTSYLAPVLWQRLLADIRAMDADMAQFKSALEVRGFKTKEQRSPARHLNTSLFRVSRHVHKVATQVFYGNNTFHFNTATTAWMQLESFLETIGPTNLREIKHIRIAAPMFHRGVQEDYVEGAIMDVMSPATRMATVHPPARDRLLSAIAHSNAKLTAAGSLETLLIDLEHPMASDLWSGRYVNDKRMISIAEAERFVERRLAGIAMLKATSDALTARGSHPILTLRHFSKASRKDVKDFRQALPAVIAEAEKYGWRVHQHLEDRK